MATVKSTQTWTVYAEVASRSEPDRQYRLDINDETGALRCTCKSFIFSGKGGRTRTCKHVQWADQERHDQLATVSVPPPAPPTDMTRALAIVAKMRRAAEECDGMASYSTENRAMAAVLIAEVHSLTKPRAAVGGPTTKTPTSGIVAIATSRPGRTRLITFD